MERVWKIANLYVATLRTIYMVHQYSHWTCKGTAFYANHLLFERLYESAQKDADLAAEKFIGVFGGAGVDFAIQTQLISQILKRYEDFDGDPVKMSLAIEKEFLKLTEEAYSAYEEAGPEVLTPGVDDMIMAIASNREEACYLLQQASSSV